MIPNLELKLNEFVINSAKIRRLTVGTGLSAESGHIDISFIVDEHIKNYFLSNEDTLVNYPLQLYSDGELLAEYVVDRINYEHDIQGTPMIKLEGRDLTTLLKDDDIVKEWYIEEISRIAKDIGKYGDIPLDVSNIEEEYLENETVSLSNSTWTSTNQYTDYGVVVEPVSGSISELSLYFHTNYRLKIVLSGDDMVAYFYENDTQLYQKKVLEVWDTSKEWNVRVDVQGSDNKIIIYVEYDNRFYKVWEIKDSTYSSGYFKLSTPDTATYQVRIIHPNRLIKYFQVKSTKFDALDKLVEQARKLGYDYQFYVRSPNKLHFEKRKYEVVRTLREFVNIMSYSFNRDVQVYNKCKVVGASVEEYIPFDRDMWTEGTASWGVGYVEDADSSGYNLMITTASYPEGGAKVGQKCIGYSVYGRTNKWCHFFFNFPETVKVKKDMLESLIIYTRNNVDSDVNNTLMLFCDEVKYIRQMSGGSWFNIDDLNKKIAQSFIAKANKIQVLGVVVDDEYSDTKPTFKLSLQTDDNGKPSGTEIWSMTFQQYGNGDFGDYNMDLSVNEGQKYWIVVECTGLGDGYGKVEYSSSKKYLDGEVKTTTDGGSTWTTQNWSLRFGIIFNYPENYFSKNITFGSWDEKELKLGENQGWSSTGNPDWDNIKGIGITFYHQSSSPYQSGIYFDGLGFKRKTQTVEIEQEADDSSLIRRIKKKIIEDSTIKEISRAIQVAQGFLERYKKPRWAGRLTVQGDVKLMAGKCVRVEIPSLKLEQDFIITQSTLNYDSRLGYTSQIELDFMPKPFTTEVAKLSKELGEVKARIRELEAIVKSGG